MHIELAGPVSRSGRQRGVAERPSLACGTEGSAGESARAEAAAVQRIWVNGSGAGRAARHGRCKWVGLPPLRRPAPRTLVYCAFIAMRLLRIRPTCHLRPRRAGSNC
ncbi:unnamed protein product, partial [Brenthis ino]